MLAPSTTRIEAFSDGVMAIIITILVLELKVPQLVEEFSGQEFRIVALNMIPKIIAYAFSFLVVAIFWVNHHNFFHNLSHSSPSLLWHNNHLLFWMSLIPLPTGFIGEHPFSSQATTAYAVVMFMAALAFTLMSRHAMFKVNLMALSVSESRRKEIIRRSWVGPALYGTAIVASFIHPYAAWMFFFAVPVYFFWPKGIIHDTATEQLTKN
jgi:uncharacterized membrane protein